MRFPFPLTSNCWLVSFNWNLGSSWYPERPHPGYQYCDTKFLDKTVWYLSTIIASKTCLGTHSVKRFLWIKCSSYSFVQSSSFYWGLNHLYIVGFRFFFLFFTRLKSSLPSEFSSKNNSISRLLYLLQQETSSTELRTECAVVLGSLAMGTENNVKSLLDCHIIPALLQGTFSLNGFMSVNVPKVLKSAKIMKLNSSFCLYS